jgi:hypothetical protein
MKLEDIASETNLRNWLTDNIDECEGRLKIEWIEPAQYGSSPGLPDCKLNGIGLELKYLLSTKKGIKWTIRPAQRRYHHMLARNGGKSALLAYIAAKNELVLVRGDHIPLRDYAIDKESGCAHGLVILEHLNYMSLDTDRQAIFELEKLLFHDDVFWRKRNAQT